MSITNEFNWYLNNTQVYHNNVNNAVDIILSNSSTPNNYFIYNNDFNKIIVQIFNSLQRVVNAAESYPCITDNDIVNKNDEISIILNKISNDIIELFENRGYQVKGFEGVAIEDGGLNFKKKF